MILLGWGLAAWAGAPPEGLRPVLAPVDAPESYRAWREGRGLPPDDLLCEPAWPGLALLCYRVWEGSRRRWVTRSDLAGWGVDLPSLHAAVADASKVSIGAAELVGVEGMDARYLRLVDGDGWAAVGFLHPEGVAQKLGGVPIRVAVPAEGVLVAWRPDGLDLDRVMSVGVRELFDAQPGGVTPVVMQWDGRAWLPFGQATPKVPEAPPG